MMEDDEFLHYKKIARERFDGCRACGASDVKAMQTSIHGKNRNMGYFMSATRILLFLN